MTDSLFSNVGLLFFATWSIVVGSVSVAAFGRDLLPAQARLNASGKHASPKSVGITTGSR